MIKDLVKNNKYICSSDNTNYMEIQSLENNVLKICAIGGGFVKSMNISNESFLQDVDNGKILFVKECPLVWKKAKLHFDHFFVKEKGEYKLKYFIEGYVPINQKWNGWSTPMVELDQIRKFNEIQKKTSTDDERYSLSYCSTFKIIDEKTISCKDFNEGDNIIIKRSEIQCGGKTIKGFDVSNGWTWSEDER